MNMMEGVGNRADNEMGKLAVQFGMPNMSTRTVGYTGGKLGRKTWTRNKIWKLLIPSY